jgi:Dynamin family
VADADPRTEAAHQALGRLVAVVQQLERTDLVDRLTAASARLNRPSTIVCVVGEFKQGKSSLVNALLGSAVCPVDDDLATSAITLVRFAEKVSVVVRHRDGDQVVSEQITPHDIPDWVSERGNPNNSRGVERVDIGMPAPVLGQGLAIVDTPGMGGLGAGHAAATLAFLPFADGLIFVSDASAELSAPEVDFLKRAAELCPTVLGVVTKTDLYSSWAQIVDLDRAHLARLGIQIDVTAVSNTVRQRALADKDRDLNERSGFPVLLNALNNDVIKPAKQFALDRSVGDARAVFELVRASLESQEQILADPTRLGEAMQRLTDAKAHLDHLRGPGAKWTQVVADRISDFSSDINHRFRGGLRATSHSLDQRIEELKTPKEWDDVARDLQSMVAEQVTEVFVALAEAHAAIRQEVVEVLAEENLELPTLSSKDHSFDATQLWEAKPLETREGTAAGHAFRSGLTGVRGAYSGIGMFGALGRYLPTAGSALLLSNPVTLGAGALFGGLQVLDERKRKITTRRQAARMQMRQFIDDVQFEIGDELTAAIRDMQRELRDEFSERLGELQRTYAETMQQAQEDGQRDQAETKERQQQLQAQLAQLAQVEQSLAAVDKPAHT